MTIKEYWNLIRQEPVLAITWEQDFPQAYSFHIMLKDHKNLHFTPIPDEANDLIFLKSPKNLAFLALCGIIFFFQKNHVLSHIAN